MRNACPGGRWAASAFPCDPRSEVNQVPCCRWGAAREVTAICGCEMTGERGEYALFPEKLNERARRSRHRCERVQLLKSRTLFLFLLEDGFPEVRRRGQSIPTDMTSARGGDPYALFPLSPSPRHGPFQCRALCGGRNSVGRKASLQTNGITCNPGRPVFTSA